MTNVSERTVRILPQQSLCVHKFLKTPSTPRTSFRSLKVFKERFTCHIMVRPTDICMCNDTRLFAYFPDEFPIVIWIIIDQLPFIKPQILVKNQRRLFPFLMPCQSGL